MPTRLFYHGVLKKWTLYFKDDLLNSFYFVKNFDYFFMCRKSKGPEFRPRSPTSDLGFTACQCLFIWNISHTRVKN